MSRKLKNEELNRLSGKAYKEAGKQRVTMVLDNIRSLHNVGSAFRTADAFRLERMLLCGVTGTPPQREIEKTALGATETVEWIHSATTAEAVAGLKKEGYQIVAVEQAEGSVSLQEFKVATEKIALIFGNEVYGVDQEVVDMADVVVEIPQFGTKHSLNVSVSIGIVVWEVVKKM